MNLFRKKFHQCFAILGLVLCLSGCGFLKSGKNTFGSIDSAFQKVDRLLGNAEKTSIDKITRKAAQGFVSGIDFDSIKVKNFIDSLFQNLNVVLGNELNELKLEGLKEELAKTLNEILQDENLSTNLQNLIIKIRGEIEGRPIDLKINPIINDKALLELLTKLKSNLLNKENSDELGLFLDRAIARFSQGEALDSILAKVNNTVGNLDAKLDEQRKDWQKFVWWLWVAIVSLVLVIVVVIAIAYRKHRQRRKYKDLALVLSKAVDSINDRTDYDTVVQTLQKDAEFYKVRTQLDKLVEENKQLYPGKVENGKKVAHAENALRTILDSDPEIRRKLIDATGQDAELSQYVQENLLTTKP